MTWEELLADIRNDLKDTGATPRWSSALLLLWAKDAIRDYSTWFPLRVDRVALAKEGERYPLPTDSVEDIHVECPLDTFLERRLDRPGARYLDTGKPIYYYTSGGGLYLSSSTEETVYLTYFATHPVPASESDATFAITVPDADIELVRLYVRANAYGQMRGKQAALDRFKVSGERDDNPLLPETESIWMQYYRGIAYRTRGGPITLYRSGRTR